MDQQTRQAALELTARGFVVIPKWGKKPAIKGWTTAKPTPADIATWDAPSIAIRTGRDSGNLIVVDCDGLTAYAAFRAAFPDLANTWTVASGSGKGMHIYFKTDILPNNIQAMKIAALDNNNIELMAEGKAVVAPPSRHAKTGRRYTVSNRAEIKHLTGDETQQLVNWIRSHQPEAERHKAERQLIDFTGNREQPEELIQAIVAVLPAHKEPNGEGWINFRCPLPGHDDRNPSAGFNIHSGVFKCFTCGSFSATTTAERLGIDWRSFQPIRGGLGLSHNIPNNRRPAAPAPAVQSVTTCKELPPVEPLPDKPVIEIRNSFRAGAGMLARAISQCFAAGAEFEPADLMKALNQAGYRMNTATVYRAIEALTGVLLEKIEFFAKSHTLKEENIQYDELRKSHRRAVRYRLMSLEACREAIKPAIMTRLIKARFPESDFAAALIEFSPRMLTDTLGTGEDTAGIAATLNQVLPLPERSRDRAQALYMECVQDYRAAVKSLYDDTVTPLDPANLPDKARSNPTAYFDALHTAQLKARDGQQVSGRAIGELIGIRDPRQRNRKLKALGIIRHAVKLHEEVKDIADVTRRRPAAFPLRIVAVSRAGDETAALSVDSPRAAEFVTTQRAAGYRVYVELQAASRIEISTPPEREPVERQPEILRFISEKSAPAPREESPEELPGRYTERWLRFHILRRLVRDPRGFYANPATGEVIPNDLTGTLAELIEALTGYHLTGRQEETA